MGSTRRPWHEKQSDVERAAAEQEALARLREYASRAEAMRFERWSAVKSAREAGVTWAAIGEALGVTRQRAQQIFAEEARFEAPDIVDRTTTALRRHFAAHPEDRQALESRRSTARREG